MAIVAFSITKRFAFQAIGDERFSNIYHYDIDPVTGEEAERFINFLQDAETPVHSTEVTFVEGRAWTVGGTPQENETLAIVDLTGTGSAEDDPAMYRECTWNVSWKTARENILDRPVYLRKYLHSCSQMTATPDEGVSGGYLPQLADTNDALRTYAEQVAPLNVGGVEYPLTAPSGRRPTEPAEIDGYLDHHELKY